MVKRTDLFVVLGDFFVEKTGVYGYGKDAVF